MKKIKKLIPWALFLGVMVGLFYWASIAARTADTNRPGEAVAIMGRDHINVGDSHAAYNSNPPTSGSHASAVPWGFSSTEIPDENAIHNLEHGGIWISYKDLETSSLDVLQNIAQKNPQSVLISPRADNDNSIAVASWGRLMKLDHVDEQVIMEFISKNINRSPEPLVR